MRPPLLRIALPCRFGCKAPAVVIVHYPNADTPLTDPLQPLCRIHLPKGSEGVVVARLAAAKEGAD